MNIKDAFLQKIKARPVPKTLTAFEMDIEEPLLDARTGPRLRKPVSKTPSPSQTSWLPERHP